MLYRKRVVRRKRSGASIRSIRLYLIVVLVGVHRLLAHCKGQYVAYVFQCGAIRRVPAANLICFEGLSWSQALVESIVGPLPAGLLGDFCPEVPQHGRYWGRIVGKHYKI